MENETKIFTGASSSSSVRGKSIDLLLVDEFAFIDDNMAEKFMQSVFPTQAAKKDAMMLLISTPKGMNHYQSIVRPTSVNNPLLLVHIWSEQ